MQRVKIYKSYEEKEVEDDFGESRWLVENCWPAKCYPPNPEYSIFDVYCMKDYSFYLVITGNAAGQTYEMIIVENTFKLIDFLNEYASVINLAYKNYYYEFHKYKTWETK